MSEEDYESQVQQVAAVMQQTVSDQSQQSSDLLDSLAGFLEEVEDVVMGSNVSIPVSVMEDVVDTLSYVQQWQTHLLTHSNSTTRFAYRPAIVNLHLTLISLWFTCRITSSFESSAAQFTDQLQDNTNINLTSPDQIVFAAEKVCRYSVSMIIMVVYRL